MRLIIVRHGETVENILGIIQGHLPGKLSSKGIKQVKKLALRLKKEKIDFIFSSDLKRAQDTAKEVAKFHPNAPLKFVKELREIHMGEFEGKKRSKLAFHLKGLKVIHIPTKKGETVEQLYKRAERFLKKILSRHPKDTVLFVGHNNINKALIAAITKKEHYAIHNIEKQHNTSVSIFEIDKNRNHKIHAFNCIKHLK
jgi:broad specificity phosphatase PhoE